ncbi:hypothetical protein SKAU_G00362560 [Synaphobranchus kaupii]|uniref:Uncharacterized protein n=1 Tax=Synaphobranchus kaupii TaxID=118154 RepID=A0A9Q1EIN5_SYNKA|nr:hypothetical protein SKAU_G00362560 [Synaphobranchus kaupii]
MAESGLSGGEEAQAPSPLSHNSWIKRWLQHFRDSNFRKWGSGTDPVGNSEQVDSAPRLRQRLLLAAVVLLVLSLMVLLLFWNYQYIMVWKLLHDQEYTSFPVFGGTEEEKDYERGRE